MTNQPDPSALIHAQTSLFRWLYDGQISSITAFIQLTSPNQLWSPAAKAVKVRRCCFLLATWHHAPGREFEYHLLPESTQIILRLEEYVELPLDPTKTHSDDLLQVHRATEGCGGPEGLWAGAVLFLWSRPDPDPAARCHSG